MRKYIFLIFILLASCVKDTDPKVFEFSTSRGLPVINTTINGKGGKLLIDSGATSSFIDARLAKHYGFGISYDGTETVTGIGGEIPMGQAYGMTVKHKDSIITLKFKTASLGDMYRITGAVGVIGSDYMIKNDLILDYNSKTLKRAE